MICKHPKFIDDLAKVIWFAGRVPKRQLLYICNSVIQDQEEIRRMDGVYGWYWRQVMLMSNRDWQTKEKNEKKMTNSYFSLGDHAPSSVNC